MKRFGLGFVGCGGYGQSLANAAAKSEKLLPVACWDVVPENAEKLAVKSGARTCSTIDELLAIEEVRGVVIASPNNAHRENAEAAAAAGKHVFVDKPIANTIEDALAIIEVCERAGVVLAVGHNSRRMAGHRKVKEMIDSGAIGKPVTVEANFSHAGGLGLKADQWRFTREGCPGLPLMQLGVHFADTAQYLLGDITEVSSFMSHVAIPADNDDVTVSLLRFEGGLLGYLGSNYATPSVYYVNVYGTGGNLYCERGGHLLYRAADSNDCRPIPLEPVDSQIEELEEFAECALSGAKPEVDGTAALKALAVVRAAIRSNEQRRPVTVAEVIEEGRTRLDRT
ncbi:MAG: Gfo/Idh/MocA family protein [Armatimonadota bacterium]